MKHLHACLRMLMDINQVRRCSKFGLLEALTQRSNRVAPVREWTETVLREQHPCVSIDAILDEFKGDTALHIAACNGHKSVVKALLRAGADASLTNQTGMTPADKA